jgi:hypothetical protein
MRTVTLSLQDRLGRKVPKLNESALQITIAPAVEQSN